MARKKIGKPSQEEEALNYWLRNPNDAVKDWFGVTPDDYQGDILHSIFNEEDRLVAKSAHGAGKSTILAWAGFIFLNCFHLSRVVATAPTFAQLHDVLWPEYAKWHAHCIPQIANKWQISGNHIRHKHFMHTWFAVSRTSNKPENLQGFHGQNIMIQGDEGSAIPPNVFEVIEGALSEAGEKGKTAKLMLMGNPNFTTGEFHNAFYRNKELYSRYTLTGDPDLLHKLGIAHGDEHTDHGRVYFAPRVSPKYRRVMGVKYGESSAVYDVRVRGVFPRADDKSVIPLEWAEMAAQVELPVFDAVADAATIVMDVSRFGGDETVLGVFRRGHCIFMQAWAKTSTNQCADYIMDRIRVLKEQAIPILRVIIDEPGVGGGVIDDLARRECPVAVVPYNGGVPMNSQVDSPEDCRMFANRRSRDWWYARRLFEVGRTHIPDDETAINQLASVQFAYNERDKIQVESKRKMRDRLGETASPDRADTIIMGLAPWVSTQSVNTVVNFEDIAFGSGRPTDELGLLIDEAPLLPF